MTILRLISFAREPHWLTQQRVVAWGLILLTEELLLILFFALGQHGLLVPINGLTSSDFVSFFAAGKLTLAGTPALVYDQAAHYAVEQQATAPGAPYQFFFYPPVFLLPCAGLALLPYLVAYGVFQLVTLTMFLGVMHGILACKGWTWIAPVLAFPAVFWNIGVGQNAFLAAALFGGFTLLMDRRPIKAGVLLGMLCYKPHFGLLAPFALAAGKHWRALLSASVTLVVLVGTSILTLGLGTWKAYFAAFPGSVEIYTSGRIDFAGMITMFGGLVLMGVDTEQAYVIQAFTALLMGGLIAVLWNGDISHPLRCASLLAATLLAVPLALVYDELLGLVAIGWLVREAREQGFLPWEKFLLAAAYPLSLLTWTVGTAWHVPLGPLISVTILSLCLRRVRRALTLRRVTRTAAAALLGISALP